MQLFKLGLVVTRSMNKDRNNKNLNLPYQLPIYSILLPVNKEGKVLANLIESIKKLDYPSYLLDVKLLIAERDQQTIEALNIIDLPNFIEVIKIPFSSPFTKPKACNYALQFAKGRYITIYDAEDKPHPQQLKQVVAKFGCSSKDIVCIQARLGFYNRNQNVLTNLFSFDYNLLYGFILRGLEKLGLPIPLGGTSNHFIKEKLLELGGWDAFNVTEDADLGIRIYQQGLKTKIIDSLTLEEAPISMFSWIKQRSRWIKGHILTSLLHLINGNNLSLKAKISIGLYILLPNVLYIPFLPYVFLHYIYADHYMDLFYQLNIYSGIIIPMVYALIIKVKEKWYDCKFAILIAPAYHFLFLIANIIAWLQIFTKPYYWEKTDHGASN